MTYDGTAVREPVRWFSEQMERKLAAHDDGRPGWFAADCDSEFLLRRLFEEAKELDEIYYDVRIDPELEKCQQIIDEAADVANFAMMLADRARANRGNLMPDMANSTPEDFKEA